jgi:hypothetical protein
MTNADRVRIFSAFGKTKSPKDHEKKEEVKAVVPKKVSSTPDKENIELEKKKEIQEPEKEEPKGTCSFSQLF